MSHREPQDPPIDSGAREVGPRPSTDPIRDAMRMLEIDWLTLEVISVLAQAGIPSILLKGPALARWLYDEEGERPYIDCDLLIPAPRADEAERILAQHGFERGGFDAIESDRPKYAIPVRRGDGPQVDLHQTFVGVGAPPDRVWKELSERTERLPIADGEVEIPSAPARTLVLALHAMKDGGRAPKVLRDLERAAGMIPAETWREAATMAERLDALTAFAAGLRRVPETAAIADELGLPVDVPVEVALRLDTRPPLAVGLQWFIASDRRGKASWVARKLFPPRAFMQEWSGLARRGTLGLLLAYVWRPIWVAWRIVPAAAAVLRARKRASKRNDDGPGADRG